MTVYGIITAGGEGRRMRALTDPRMNRYARPKAMLPVGTRVLIDFSIEALRGLGLKTIYVGMGPRPYSEILERHITNEGAYKVEVKTHTEEEILDTAGTVKYLLEHYIYPNRNDTICVLPCDMPNNIDLAPILTAHEDRGAAVTVASLPLKWSSEEWRERTFGTIRFKEMKKLEDYKGDRNLFEADNMAVAKNKRCSSVRVTGFHEHQERDKAESNFINTGIYFFNAGFLMDLAPHITRKSSRPRFSDFGHHLYPLLGGRAEEFPFLAPDFLRRVANEEFPFYAYLLPADNYWRDVGNPLALLKANMDFLTGELSVPLAAGDPFWQRHAWGLQGKFGTYIPDTAHKIFEPPDGRSLGSIIGSHVNIETTARIVRSVILDYSEIRGEVVNSVCFPGSAHEVIEGRPTIRRGVIGRRVKLNNSIFVGGTLRHDLYASKIKDQIIYETAYGGIAYDPL